MGPIEVDMHNLGYSIPLPWNELSLAYSVIIQFPFKRVLQKQKHGSNDIQEKESKSR